MLHIGRDADVESFVGHVGVKQYWKIGSPIDHYGTAHDTCNLFARLSRPTFVAVPFDRPSSNEAAKGSVAVTGVGTRALC
jgi:hypothetical protein